MWNRQLEAILKELEQHEYNEQSNARALAAGLAALLKSCWRTEQMTQALVDAVATLTGNVQSLTDTVVAHDSAMQSLIAALQAAIANNPGTAQDPDIARSIDAISAASAGVAAAATKVNDETVAMVAAVAPQVVATPPADGGTATGPSS